MSSGEERFRRVKDVVNDSNDYDFDKIYSDYKDEIDLFTDKRFLKYLQDLEERYNDHVHNVYKGEKKFMILHGAAVTHSL